jgi:hypothetical protein
MNDMVKQTQRSLLDHFLALEQIRFRTIQYPEMGLGNRLYFEYHFNALAMNQSAFLPGGVMVMTFDPLLFADIAQAVKAVEEAHPRLILARICPSQLAFLIPKMDPVSLLMLGEKLNRQLPASAVALMPYCALPPFTECMAELDALSLVAQTRENRFAWGGKRQTQHYDQSFVSDEEDLSLLSRSKSRLGNDRVFLSLSESTLLDPQKRDQYLTFLAGLPKAMRTRLYLDVSECVVLRHFASVLSWAQVLQKQAVRFGVYQVGIHYLPTDYIYQLPLHFIRLHEGLRQAIEEPLHHSFLLHYYQELTLSLGITLVRSDGLICQHTQK